MKNEYLVSLMITVTLLAGFTGCNPSNNENQESWMIGPFEKMDRVNPVLTPLDSTTFLCPVRDELVHWEAKDVFNPAAVVKDGKIYLLYRAEDRIGKLLGTSRIGIAESTDGLTFKRFPTPVLYPDNDAFKSYEWEGGCEDPRVVEDGNGTYYMTYTAWNGEEPRLFVATSRDLFHWQKHGSAFTRAFGGKYARIHSKSGSIVCKPKDDRMVATRINGKYWMYFGDTDIYLASSDDLVNWTPMETAAANTQQHMEEPADLRENLMPVIQPRKGKFDSDLVEPGPPAMVTENGILLIYNSRNNAITGDTTLPDGTYAAGQALFDLNNPEKLIKRSESYFIKPDKPYEITGQVNNVCFVEGLAHYKGTWFLYYGTADSKIAVATAPANGKNSGIQ